MAKYDPLARYLTEQVSEVITLSFAEISAILGDELPQSAYDHRPWWANRYDGKDAQNLGWQSAGWETKDVDMKRERVTFVRTVKVRQDFTEAPHVKPLTIEEAKRGLAENLGLRPENISITINA